jgi:glycosyltransferase involved in cell wall biosynthesis
MAYAPYFVISPNTLLSLVGHLRDRTFKTAPDAANATVDVLIPARNEEDLIAVCIESIARQTRRPDRVILIDDNSTDRTIAIAQEAAAAAGLALELRRRETQQGKTPSVRETAYESSADVEFVLDADTILDSPDYIERTVAVLMADPAIASVCGVVEPLRERDRRQVLASENLKLVRARLGMAPPAERRLFHRAARGITNLYREVLYYFLQHIVYRGQMGLYRSIVNPVGCAVAYRRRYLRGLFDHYQPILGDDLTFSEDIFIGFAFLEQGLLNVQLEDISCRSQEPEAQRAPKQVFLWSSAFLQSCYYFPALVFSPIKRLARLFGASAPAEPPPTPAEGWQATRERATLDRGRPIGWSVFLELFEKASFPLVLIAMLGAQWWQMLVLTLAVETGVLALMSFVTGRPDAAAIALKSFLVAPLRYGSMLFDLVTFARFFYDVLFGRAHRWRK